MRLPKGPLYPENMFLAKGGRPVKVSSNGGGLCSGYGIIMQLNGSVNVIG